jgi:hypothetical protein
MKRKNLKKRGQVSERRREEERKWDEWHCRLASIACSLVWLLLL